MVPSSQILSGAGACLATGVNQRPQGLPLGAVPFRSVGFGPAPSTPPPILALSLLFERSEITSRIAASALLQVVLLAAERATQGYRGRGKLPCGGAMSIIAHVFHSMKVISHGCGKCHRAILSDES